jgi:hypothetical protein
LQDHVRTYIEADVARRSDARYSADLGAFIALLSVFGQVPRIANSPKLAPESRLEDVDGWWFGFFNYLASGPPPDRLQQMLALERAGIVRFVGPDMWLEADAEQLFRAGSPAVNHVIEAHALVDARLPEASVNACVEPLVRDLSERGATVEEVLVGTDGRPLPTGRLKVDREFRVVDRDGRPHRRRLAIGAYATMRSPAFARPRTNAPGFRHNDTIARAMLRSMTDDHPLHNPAWQALTPTMPTSPTATAARRYQRRLGLPPSTLRRRELERSRPSRTGPGARGFRTRSAQPSRRLDRSPAHAGPLDGGR